MKPPPIIVDITNTKSELTFKISDQGGGIPPEKMETLWSFGKPPNSAMEHLENFHKIPGLTIPKKLPIEEHHYFRDLSERTHSYLTDDLGNILDTIGTMEMTSHDDSESTLESLASRPFELTLGISLPMCKVYTDYWNGVLEASSMYGYGSDFYLKLRKLGNKSDTAQLDKA